jgi:hypothetical protein
MGVGLAGGPLLFPALDGRGLSSIFESNVVVGSIVRVGERRGWRSDIGGHRLFAK